jgi:NADH:ubiquinone oxidoreductase subunit 5 (subunit L)/multisubunit Na+/H+ antiporter MnhA subunit
MPMVNVPMLIGFGVVLAFIIVIHMALRVFAGKHIDEAFKEEDSKLSLHEIAKVVYIVFAVVLIGTMVLRGYVFLPTTHKLAGTVDTEAVGSLTPVEGSNQPGVISKKLREEAKTQQVEKMLELNDFINKLPVNKKETATDKKD